MTDPQWQPLEQLSPSTLVSQVRDEMNRYLSGEGYRDERYCMELIRRVATNQDADAWAALYAQFAPLVLSWLVRRARGKEAIALEGADSLVNAAFTKLWMALRPGTKRFNSVGKFLSYLKLCAGSVLADWWRGLPMTLLPGNEGISHIPAPNYSAVEPHACGYSEGEAEASDDPAAEVIARLSFQELYRIIQNVLQGEDERAIGFLSLLCDLPPNAIFQERQDLFPTVEDVYRVKRNVLERLQRNQQLLAYVHGKAAGGKVSARREHSVDRDPPSVRPKRSLAAQYDLERQLREPAQRELLSLLQQRALCEARSDLLSLLQQRALCEARSDLLRIVEEQTRHIVEQTAICEHAGVRYYRRPTFCGKQRCRRCREGIGHGPYWYAYTVVNGRTVSVYLGKELSPVSWESDRPSLHRTGRVQAEAQQREHKITYHCQVSFCGKQRCRRCREGIGHGPYWYAYTVVNGRTVRKYLGQVRPQ